MNRIGKKYALVTLIMSFISGFLQADTACNRNCEAALCPYQSCYPQMLCCEDPPGFFFVRGDFLYWKPHIAGDVVKKWYASAGVTIG